MLPYLLSFVNAALIIAPTANPSLTVPASVHGSALSPPSVSDRAKPRSAKASYFWYVNSMRSVSSLISNSLCTKHLFTVAQAIQKGEAGLICTDRPSAESLSQILFPLTQKVRPEFHLVMDFAQLKQKHSTWPRMITQEHVPDVSQFCNWWLPDCASGEGRNKQYFRIFLGEGTHKACKNLSLERTG